MSSDKSFTNEFKCPECGSNMFGTSDCVDWIKPIGHCHGFKKDGQRCTFSWCRKTQDDWVFVGASRK